MPEEEKETTQQTEDTAAGADFQTGSITVEKNGHFIHCLTIIGQIEGHYILPSQNKTTKYEHVIPQLVAIEESQDVEGLLIILNTVGGDVKRGWQSQSCCLPCEPRQHLLFWAAGIPLVCPLLFPVTAALLFPVPP